MRVICGDHQEGVCATYPRCWGDASLKPCPCAIKVSEPIEVEDVQLWQPVDWTVAMWQDAFSNAIAAFEELAGEHNVTNKILHEVMAEPDGHLVPSEDQVSVRPYVRRKARRSKKFGGWYLCDECGEPHDNPPGPCPRRSKSVTTEATPTGDKEPDEIGPQTKAEGRGEASEAAIHAAYDAYWAHYSGSGKRADLGGQYFRSRWEANYARYLNFLMANGEPISGWAYEPETFEFKRIRRGTRFYTPDFRVRYQDGHLEYHEVKGWDYPKGRTARKRFAKYYPHLKLVLIDREFFAGLRKQGMDRLISGWEYEVRPNRKPTPCGVMG